MASYPPPPLRQDESTGKTGRTRRPASPGSRGASTLSGQLEDQEVRHARTVLQLGACGDELSVGPRLRKTSYDEARVTNHAAPLAEREAAEGRDPGRLQALHVPVA